MKERAKRRIHAPKKERERQEANRALGACMRVCRQEWKRQGGVGVGGGARAGASALERGRWRERERSRERERPREREKGREREREIDR